MIEPSTVSVIGLGRMGGPIADRLIAAGHRVSVCDVEQAALEPRIAAGAIAADTPAEAAREARLVSVVVFDDDQARAVVSGPSGVLSTLQAGAVVCVHTTITLPTIEELANNGLSRGVAVIDSGISGGEDGARSGTLVTMVGGPDEVIERARPVLLAYCKEVIHAGPLGAGMALKLARNATGYVMMAAVHEAMELCRSSGIDKELLLHTITETGVLSQALSPFDLGGPESLADDAPPEQRAPMEHLNRLATKDLAHAMALSERYGIDTPLVAEARREFWRTARMGRPRSGASD